MLGFVAGKSSPLSGYSQSAKRLCCDQTEVKEMRDSCLPDAPRKITPVVFGSGHSEIIEFKTAAPGPASVI